MSREYMVCYDITEPARLQKIHRYVANNAEFMQLSVYRLSADQTQFREFVSVLNTLICPKNDDVRIYPLSPTIKPEIWGRKHGIDGVNLLL